MTAKAILSKPRQKRPAHNAESDIKSEQPIIPMNKVSLDVIKKLQTEPYPQLTLATHSTISEALELYYNEYVRLFRQNQILNDELASILLERNGLADQFNQIKKMKSYDDNIRRRRRYASQIQRNYHCPMPKCNKGYGSQGSLTHHVRLKHPKFFQSGEYEIYLETYILPKQEIKNEDGNDVVDVEEMEQNMKEVKRSLEGKGNKVEVIDDEVKQAKEEELQKQKEKNLANVVRRKNAQTSQQTVTQTGEPLTPQLHSMMRQVDGYIVLESQRQESKLDSHQKQVTTIPNQTQNEQQQQQIKQGSKSGDQGER